MRGYVGVVALPHRDRRAPEPVAADRPVAGVREPLAEAAVLDVLGHPVDLLVQLDHPVAERGHLRRTTTRSPGRRAAGRSASSAGRSGCTCRGATTHAAILERPDHVRVGVEHVLALAQSRTSRGEAAVLVHRARRSGCRRRCRRSGRPRRSRAPCARRRCRPRSTRSRRPSTWNALPPDRVGEEVEQRRVAAADEVGALDGADLRRRPPSSLAYAPSAARGEHVALAARRSHAPRTRCRGRRRAPGSTAASTAWSSRPADRAVAGRRSSNHTVSAGSCRSR